MKEIKSDIEDKWNTVEKFFSTINLRSIGKSIIEGLEKVWMMRQVVYIVRRKALLERLKDYFWSARN